MSQPCGNIKLAEMQSIICDLHYLRFIQQNTKKQKLDARVDSKVFADIRGSLVVSIPACRGEDPGSIARPRSFRVRQFEAELQMPERHAAFDGRSVSSSSLSLPSWCLLRIVLCLLVSDHALPTLALLLHKLIALTRCPGGLRGLAQVPLA